MKKRIYHIQIYLASAGNRTRAARVAGEHSTTVSFDPMSRDSSGHHNAAIDYINRRLAKVNEKHRHYNTWRRFHRGRLNRRDKSAKCHFPLFHFRFADDGDLKPEEKDILVSAAMMALVSDDDLSVGDACFTRKF